MGNTCKCTRKKDENNSPTKISAEDVVTVQPESRNKQQIAIDEISIDILPKQAPDIKLGEKNKNDKDRKKEKKEKENKKKENEKKKEKEEKKSKNLTYQNGQENNDTFTGIGEDSQGQGLNASEANSSRHIAQNTGDGLSLPQAAHKYISNERLSTADKGISEEQGQNEKKSMDSRKPDTNNKTNTNSKTSANQDNGQSKESSSNTDRGGSQGRGLKDGQVDEPGNQLKKDNEAKQHKQSTGQTKGNSSELSFNADKGRSRGQGMNAGQVSVSGKECSSNNDKRGSQGHGLNEGQVNEPGNFTTNTGTKSGSRQSMTSQKSETSGNVTRISVNQSGTQHSQTSQKDEKSRYIETSHSTTTKSAEPDQKPKQENESVASGTSERGDAQQLLKEKEEEIKKLIAERQADLTKMTLDRENIVKNKQMEIVRIQSEKDMLEKEKKELLTREDAQQRLLKEKEEEITKLMEITNERQAELTKMTHDWEYIVKNKQMEIARIQSEKDKLEKEKEELLTRLSAMAGRKLTDNNPNIADLSDLNRPTKLAEKFSELYDNAWTDAFSVVQEQEGYKDNDEKAVKVLLDILTAAYMEAYKAAEQELKSLKEIIERFQRSADEKNVKDVMKQLKDSRKKKVLPSEELKQVYYTAVEKLELDVSLSEKLKEYKDQCLELCWLMVIQDPPVFLQCEACKEGEKFDKNTYREYTQGGDKVAFAVWPALFLEKGGALLSKGVVQCKKRPMSASFNSKTGGLEAFVNNPKSQSLKMQGNSKMEIPKALQTEIRIPDAEKNKTTQNSDGRRNSASQSQHF